MRAIATFSLSKLTAHLSHRGHITAVEYDAAHVGIDESYLVTRPHPESILSAKCLRLTAAGNRVYQGKRTS